MSQILHLEITVVDQFWPDLKIIVVNRTTNTVREKILQYDLAATGFEPIVNDAVRMAVQSLIRRRKGETSGSSS